MEIQIAQEKFISGINETVHEITNVGIATGQSYSPDGAKAHPIMWFRVAHKRHLDRFSQGSRSLPIQYTDRHTDHATPFVAIGCIYAMHAMRPKIQWKSFSVQDCYASRPVMVQSIAMSVSVSLSLCLCMHPIAYLKNHTSKLYHTHRCWLCTLCGRSLLGHPLTTTQFVTHFWSCGTRHFSHNGKLICDPNMAYAHKVTHQLAAPGGEVCYLRLPCFLHETRSWTVVERPRGTLWQLKIEIVSTAAQPFEKMQNSCNRRRTMMLIQHHRKRRGYVQRQLKVRAMVYGGTLILLCRSFIASYTLSNNYIVRAYLKIKKN